jgi:predicted DsbA family dithiol-disulfide isomerase
MKQLEIGKSQHTHSKVPRSHHPAIEKFRERNPTQEFDIRMHPFQLNGVLTETPISRREWGESKFGAERWAAVSSSLCAKFKAVGIISNPEGFMSASHLAHRLTEYAGTVNPAVQLPLSMDLFTLHHVEGVHLSDSAALAKIAVKHGLFPDTAAAAEWLNTGCSCLDVKKGYQRAQRNGITGVPFFVFQDKYAASGAMGVDEFVDVSKAMCGLGVGVGRSCALHSASPRGVNEAVSSRFRLFVGA